jgi:hypothetical protein
VRPISRALEVSGLAREFRSSRWIGQFGFQYGLSRHFAPTSQAFVAMLGAAGSPTAYGDAAYSSNMLLNQSGFDERIQMAYHQAAVGKNQLPSHLLYGTDWSLLEQIGNNDEYMRFTQLFASFSGPACERHSPEECFFGWNAVEYLGLRAGLPGKTARSRLETFYAQHCMPKPIWMQKVANS